MVMTPRARLLVAASALVFFGLAPALAEADPGRCQVTYVKQLLRLKKKFVQLHNRCVDRQNLGTLSGPCPDLLTAAKIADVEEKVREKIVSECSLADAMALGFPGDCSLGAVSDGAQDACAALPVTTPAEFADCLMCWKEAELKRYVATLYASHAVELCGGDVGAGSEVCSNLGCTTPLPDQRDLGDTGENDCQRSIGKGGFKYLLLREKFLEKCALRGLDRSTCLADPDVLVQLAKANQVKDNLIMRKCGSRDPAPSPPFCCRTGMGNSCSIASTPDECENVLGGEVQEGKTCDMGSCAPLGGNKKVTWWGFCPQSLACPGTALTTLDDLKGCVATTGDAVADELLCLQFPANGGADWPCPAGPPGSPSGAFLDGPGFF
jgi:hypothetical protein